MKDKKLPILLATTGVLGGVIVAMKGGKSTGWTAAIALLFGVAGFYAGSTISKFYK